MLVLLATCSGLSQEFVHLGTCFLHQNMMQQRILESKFLSRVEIFLYFFLIIIFGSIFCLDGQLLSELGCFDIPSGDLSPWKAWFNYEETLSVDLCLDTCKNNLYKLAILYNGERCACADTHLLTRFVPDSGCNIACPVGNGTIKGQCGGQSRWSVYAVTF